MQKSESSSHWLLPTWQERMATIEQKRRAGEDSELQWIDQIRSNILRYLIARYGTQDDCTVLSDIPVTATPRKALVLDFDLKSNDRKWLSTTPLRVSAHRVRTLLRNIAENAHPEKTSSEI